jgi:hypothetical protein
MSSAVLGDYSVTLQAELISELQLCRDRRSIGLEGHFWKQSQAKSHLQIFKISPSTFIFNHVTISV